MFPYHNFYKEKNKNRYLQLFANANYYLEISIKYYILDEKTDNYNHQGKY